MKSNLFILKFELAGVTYKQINGNNLTYTASSCKVSKGNKVVS